MWIEPERLSRWAFYECLKNDNPTIRSLITDSEWAFEYCRKLKDVKKIRDKITDSYWAFKYCTCIKDRPEVRNSIKPPWDYWFKSITKRR